MFDLRKIFVLRKFFAVSKNFLKSEIHCTKFDILRHELWSSTCPLTGFFWLFSHVIYLKLTKVLYECLLSQAEWWVAELLFLSLNNWGLNFLQNECSQSSQIYLSPEKLRKVFTFQSCKFLNDKIDQKINFAKLPIAK